MKEKIRLVLDLDVNKHIGMTTDEIADDINVFFNGAGQLVISTNTHMPYSKAFLKVDVVDNNVTSE